MTDKTRVSPLPLSLSLPIALLVFRSTSGRRLLSSGRVFCGRRLSRYGTTFEYHCAVRRSSVLPLLGGYCAIFAALLKRRKFSIPAIVCSRCLQLRPSRRLRSQEKVKKKKKKKSRDHS